MKNFSFKFVLIISITGLIFSIFTPIQGAYTHLHNELMTGIFTIFAILPYAFFLMFGALTQNFMGRYVSGAALLLCDIILHYTLILNPNVEIHPYYYFVIPGALGLIIVPLGFLIGTPLTEKAERGEKMGKIKSKRELKFS